MSANIGERKSMVSLQRSERNDAAEGCGDADDVLIQRGTYLGPRPMPRGASFFRQKVKTFQNTKDPMPSSAGSSAMLVTSEPPPASLQMSRRCAMRSDRIRAS
eukprot:scaffold213_cov245-Pinguiococcus_pyrenoidosus.AAC.4